LKHVFTFVFAIPEPFKESDLKKLLALLFQNTSRKVIFKIFSDRQMKNILTLKNLGRIYLTISILNYALDTAGFNVNLYRE